MDKVIVDRPSGAKYNGVVHIVELFHIMEQLSYLQELAQSTGETVSLGILDGDQVYYIDQIHSRHNIRLKDWTGHLLPLHATSDGKLFLAHWSDSALDGYLHQPLYPHSADTITDPDLLRQELACIRSQGYAWNNREYDADLVGLAVPITDETSHVVASLCMFGPFFRFPLLVNEKHMSRLRLIRRAASPIVSGRWRNIEKWYRVLSIEG
jgi:DNA-binding IclR family transcriptional regulator